jgi:hypothetical protein
VNADEPVGALVADGTQTATVAGKSTLEDGKGGGLWVRAAEIALVGEFVAEGQGQTAGGCCPVGRITDD